MRIDLTDLDSLLEKEWLLTNRRGSYASGTVIGCNTRRYHGLLVAALTPPVGRVVMLSNILETVTVEGQSFELANFEFSDRLHPQGYRYLEHFYRDNGVHFTFQLGQITVEKSIYLDMEEDLLIVRYEFSGPRQKAGLSLMPLLAMRDFHGLQSSSNSLNVERDGEVVTVRVLDPSGPSVHLYCEGAKFSPGSDWWYAMRYRQETRRGQDDYEDVWPPGSFTAQVDCPGQVTLIAHATTGLERPGPLDFNVDEIIDEIRRHNEHLISRAGAQDEKQEMLIKAADQFMVRRRIGQGRDSASIMAGFHWFADWGRDALISLPGLLLATGRFDLAGEVLTTFASAVDQGMIPNRFDEYGRAAHYNSVDASLWFINAVYQYLQATGDKTAFRKKFQPLIREIISAYSAGARFNIHADTDGLIAAGDADTQLTWMDAKCNGVTFTPRYGKAVEVNALWINALYIMAQAASRKSDRQRYKKMADKAARHFAPLFWNERTQCLNDCVFPDGGIDEAIRPNQIFAVSLPFSALSPFQQNRVVTAVSENLLTPFGLRSLSPRDGRYQGHYQGDQFQRDSAYHQGTVWAYLMGPFAEAYLKVNRFSPHAKEQVAEMIQPLLEHLSEDGCLGSVSEIFDGDYPHTPKGCIAQAWSVAELLRIKKMVDE
ncbi:MAG: hypothetical protein AMJ79_12920 [Phycisphaerae bacterium SM23_30]|nr:MAG: hypothetical protein AMJ79_12920 [Phycisphaerae bacterium SM23_30]